MGSPGPEPRPRFRHRHRRRRRSRPSRPDENYCQSLTTSDCPGFRRARPRSEDAKAVIFGFENAFLPQSGFPDAGFAFEQEDSRTSVAVLEVEERGKNFELMVAADKRGHAQNYAP